MDIVTLDFETFYDEKNGYTLKRKGNDKMTIEEYVNHELFEVFMVARKVNDEPVEVAVGAGVEDFLKSMDYSDKAILCHNTSFDGAILNWWFGIEPPAIWFDTYAMAMPVYGKYSWCSLADLCRLEGIGEKGGFVSSMSGKRLHDLSDLELADFIRYNRLDVDLCYKLFQKLKHRTTSTELQIIDQAIRMYVEPTVVLDKPILEEHLSQTIEAKNHFFTEVSGGLSPEEAKTAIRKNDTLAAWLEAEGVEVPMKYSEKQDKQVHAFAKTDIGFTDLQSHPNPRVQALVSARLESNSTLEETRTQRLIGIADRMEVLPISLKYWGAHTGRFSGDEKQNLQNLPRGGILRNALVAPEGFSFVVSDLSQIEARMLAWLAGEEELLDVFRRGEDPYCWFASSLYGREITKADKDERFMGKTGVLGLGYGLGHVMFRIRLVNGSFGAIVILPENEAKWVVDFYRQKHRNIQKFWYHCGDVLGHMTRGISGRIKDLLPYESESIQLPSGMWLNYPALFEELEGGRPQYFYCKDPKIWKKHEAYQQSGGATDKPLYTKLYGAKLTENIIQSLARIVITDAMVKIGQHYKIVFQVHDEVIVLCEDRDVEDCVAYVNECMTTPPAWLTDFPLACETAVGKRYGDAK